MDYTEKWGVDVKEAVNLALADLKVSIEEVEVEVLEEPTKGFLGIGAKLAKVRVSKIKLAKPVEDKPAKAETVPQKIDTKPQKADAKPQKADAKPQREEKKARKEKRERTQPKERAPEEKFGNLALDDIDVSELAVVEEHEALTFLKDITEKMGLDLDFVAREGKEMVYLEMNGQDSRTVIGKRGQTLDAIQYLTSLVVNKDKEKYTKVVVDAENYRAKRQKTLEQLANRLAAKVIKTRKYVRLEPMNPYERKVIHATLQKNANITTRSEGEEPYRRVIIEIKK